MYNPWPVGRFHVLIHAPLYAALRRLPVDVRSRFRRQVEHLSAGRWGGGTRVKKLRGCAKPVYEARQDAADRILFTLAHTAARAATATLPPHLQIWDLVRHDRVSGRSARINASAEAEFLEYEEVESELIGEPPPHPAASFADIPPLEAGSEAGVLELVIPPDALRPPVREELVGGVRWYVLPESLVLYETAWQALMDAGVDELELKLTGEQYDVVRAPGPVLLSGSAGSGKTTIAVHRLAAAASAPGSPRTLYVTYSRWLLDHARRLFGDLLVARGEPAAPSPAFLTIADLYRAILAAAGATPPARVVDYPEFAGWYRAICRREDAALAWEEIRSIVKGASLDPEQPLVAREEYEALGRKRAPLFVGERPRLYEVARRWQEHLAARGVADEIDLCRQALGRVPTATRFDHILCDEAQDLAEVQVELLLRLHRGADLGGLFLAGDPQQVINPSGFRWAEVRSRIRDRFLGRGRPVPELHVLTRNFRSVRGLVDLANEVLALKRERIGRSDGDQPEDAVVTGAVPILVAGSETDLVEAVRGFGPRCAVLAGSDEIRTRLQAALETTRVFTVAEAKGLEFEAVVLWEIVGADPHPWRRLLDSTADLREDPAGRRALHHLYVAVTRARRYLAVYEPPDAPPLWTTGRFAARLDSDAPASLSRLFVRSALPEEWMREAEYFLERGRHRQAAECFRRAGDARREAESLALHHEARGEARLAAERWLALGETVRAARCLEEASDFEAAAREWDRAGEEASARRCVARAAESAGRWSEGATAWEALEAWESAARCWANLGNRSRQIRCLALAADKDGRAAVAAARWEELEDWPRAAAAWRGAGREREARAAEAREHESARRWHEAAQAWRDGGHAERALPCEAKVAEGAGRWKEAAVLWESLLDFTAAMQAWERSGDRAAARRCAARRDLRDGRLVRAAEAFEDIGAFADAAEAWHRAAEARQQPSTPRALPLPAAATRAWGEGGKPARLARPEPRRGRAPRRPRAERGAARSPLHEAAVRGLVCAARDAEDGARFDEAARAWRALADEEQVLRCRVTHLDRAGEPRAAAALLESKQRYAAAAARHRQVDDRRAAARCDALEHEKRGRLEEAAAVWGSLGESTREARCRASLHFQRREYDAAARLYDVAGDADTATTARFLAAKLRGDYDAAGQILDAAGMGDARPRLLGDRARWLAEARTLAATNTRPAGRPRPVRTPPFPDAIPPSPQAAGERSPHSDAGQHCQAIVAAVRRDPGLTCEQLAAVTRIPTAQVKPIVARLTAEGRLRKTGRTRGTRYLLA